MSAAKLTSTQLGQLELGTLLAAEAYFLQAHQWVPHSQHGVIRWADPEFPGSYLLQTEAVSEQKRRSGYKE